MLLIISLISTIFLNTNYIIKEIKAEDTIEDINFDSPFNNTFNLVTPFLVEYDNTTGLKPIGIRTTNITSEDFEVKFSGFGVINYANDTIRYNSNGSGIYITNPDGTVYQTGIIELRTEEGNDTAKAEYESIGDQADEENVWDNGIMLFNSSSSNGELSFLNNTVAVYKDMIGYANVTTIAWQWK
ncbi:MAG TPA: hypothetical protein VKA95_01805 [Nitrososphaeraceae archaeon]|nr:hypothetical protein [Nitrososphaeraceae archaeon]